MQQPGTFGMTNDRYELEKPSSDIYKIHVNHSGSSKQGCSQGGREDVRTTPPPPLFCPTDIADGNVGLTIIMIIEVTLFYHVYLYHVCNINHSTFHISQGA